MTILLVKYFTKREIKKVTNSQKEQVDEG